MSRLLLRVATSGRGSSNVYFEESPKKERVEKEEDDRNRKNGTMKHRYKLIVSLLRFSSILIVVLALTGSFWWTISLTSVPNHKVFRGYRRLQEQLLSDIYEIGDLTLGLSRPRELEYCSEEYQNYVPCFNSSENLALGYSDGKEYDRHCEKLNKRNCLLLTPANYRIPLRWPTGKYVIWMANVKISAEEVLLSGSEDKRVMVLGEDQLSFPEKSASIDIDDIAYQIAGIIGLRNVSYFGQVGVRNILDIECGYGSFGAHLYSHQLLTMCLAKYEASGSQVQITLQRGLPAMIGSFTNKQLPFPSLSFDIVHCSRCHVEWEKKDGIHLIEADRLLRPGGYFVLKDAVTNSQRSPRKKDGLKKWNAIRSIAENLCWEMFPQQDEMVVWRKTSKRSCYAARKTALSELCSKDRDIETPYYRNLQSCIGGSNTRRWIPLESRRRSLAQDQLNSTELAIYGLSSQEFDSDAVYWRSSVTNYWSLLSPVIFSDHPKRPGDEDPSPPYNMMRNVMDMNARFGGLNAAFLETGKSVWVMNAIPTKGPNTLPLILDRGFLGVLHDWCEPFPTYPRTYDLVHAQGLLSLEFSEKPRCQMMDLFGEIDRILRPEGWVILKDRIRLIELARSLATQFKWEARIIEIENSSDERLLICQKPFLKQQAS